MRLVRIAVVTALVLTLTSTELLARHGRTPWCGMFMRTQVGHDPGPAFNLAHNWKRWGSPASPGYGVVVVFFHRHVGKIVGWNGDCRTALVLSGNDGNAVRTRPRNVCGMTFRTG